MAKAKAEIECMHSELFDEMGETITLNTTPFKCEVEALVTLPDQFSITQQGERQTIQGQVYLKESGFKSAEVSKLTVLVIRESMFHITSIGLPDGGLVKLDVQRSDREHTTVSALDPI